MSKPSFFLLAESRAACYRFFDATKTALVLVRRLVSHLWWQVNYHTGRLKHASCDPRFFAQERIQDMRRADGRLAARLGLLAGACKNLLDTWGEGGIGIGVWLADPAYGGQLVG